MSFTGGVKKAEIETKRAALRSSAPAIFDCESPQMTLLRSFTQFAASLFRQSTTGKKFP